MNRFADETERMLGRLDGLYQRDPEAFEVLRRELLERVIAGFRPEQRERARAQQFALDARLARYKHPVARLNKMIELFWAQFDEFRRALNDPGALADRAGQRHRGGKVIALRGRDRVH